MDRVGWIKLYRKMENNKLYFQERFTKMQAWIDLLILAKVKKETFFIRGIEVELLPGQLFWSQEELAKRWKWDRKTVRRFYSFLVKDSQITYKVHNRIGITSIVNWNKYQDKRDNKRDNKRDSNKEDKEVKETTEVAEKKNKKEYHSPTSARELIGMKEIIITEEGGGEQWQILAQEQALKLKLNQKDTRTLFRLFKDSRSNCFEIERLCNLAFEANAYNPIGYINNTRKREKLSVKA